MYGSLLPSDIPVPPFDGIGCACQEGWEVAPAGRFNFFVSIRGRSRQHECSGIVIKNQWVVTPAYCIDSVGPNPILIPTSTTYREVVCHPPHLHNLVSDSPLDGGITVDCECYDRF